MEKLYFIHFHLSVVNNLRFNTEALLYGKLRVTTSYVHVLQSRESKNGKIARSHNNVYRDLIICRKYFQADKRKAPRNVWYGVGIDNDGSV